MGRSGIARAFMSGKESNVGRDGCRPICAIAGLDARFVVDLYKARNVFQRDDKTVAVVLRSRVGKGRLGLLSPSPFGNESSGLWPRA